MKAMLIPRYGGPDVFEFGEAPMPVAGPQEILVRARASSVNPFDCHMRSGAMKSWLRLRLPAVIGIDVAGDVVGVGSEVTRFKVGDRVFAYLDPTRAGGAYAEFVSVPEAFAAPVPKNLGFEEAGVMPGVGLTAHEALVEHAPVEAGMRVLINGAAGGVGTFAVQIAKARGAHVTGVCRGAKGSYLRRIGADEVIDYQTHDVLKTGSRFDVVLQAARTDQLAGLRRLLTPRGRIVTITGGPVTMVGAKVRNVFSAQKTIAFVVKHDGRRLEALSRMVEDGTVRPCVDQTFSWRDLAEAHRRVETGRVTGKIAIRIDA